MLRARSRRRPARIALTICAAALPVTAASAAALPAGALAADPTTPITSGHLDWGLKQSFRSYIAGPIAHGSIALSAGATTNPDGSFRFPVTGGSFDAESNATIVQLGGAVHFSGHAGQLEMDLSDPRVELTSDGAQLLADVESKQLEGGATITYPDVALAQLDISEASPTLGGSVLSPVTTWTALPATLTQPGAPAFAGFYAPGTTLDPVTLTYDGPGGKPALEQWTAPGISKYSLTGTLTPRAGWTVYTVLPDESRGLAHAVWNTGGGTVAVQALDARTLAPRGEPLTVALGYQAATIDPQTGTVFVHTVPSGADSKVTLLRWSPETLTYATEAVPTTNTVARILAFDPLSQTLFGIQDDNYYGQPVLTGSGADWSFTNYAAERMDALSMALRDVVVATDGTLLEVDNSYYNVTVPIVTRHYDATTRTVSRRAVAGQESLDMNGLGFTWIQPGPDATAYAAEFKSQRGYVVKLSGRGGSWAVDGAPLRTGIAASGIAVDPNDATLGILDGAYDIQILRDGAPVRTIPNPNVGGTLDPHIVTGSGGTMYLRADWYEASGGSAAYAIGRSGASPALTQEPQDVALDLAAGDASAGVAFTAAADGSPAPGVRWQVRSAGSTRWSDVPGATAPTLALSATAADAGSRYRALFENAAGTIATAPATLSVRVLPPAADPGETPGDGDPGAGGPGNGDPGAGGPGAGPGPGDSPAPGGPAGPGGGANPPTPAPPARPAAPKASRLTLSATKLSVRLSGAARASARVERRTIKRVRRNGRTRTTVVWHHVRTLALSSTRAGTVDARLPRLPAGTYRVTVRATAPGAAASSRLVRTLVVRTASTRSGTNPR